MFRDFALFLLALLLTLAVAPAAGAQTADTEDNGLPARCQVKEGERLQLRYRRQCRPLEIQIESDIDFGRIVLMSQGEGTVMLDLESGQKIIVGDVEDLGGLTIAGRVTITGTPLEPVRIVFPWRVAMHDYSGAQAEIREFTTDLPTFPVLDPNGEMSFSFTGKLMLSERTAATGKLRGRVPISVSYFK